MRYLPLIILTVLMMGLIMGCTGNVPPEKLTTVTTPGESVQASQVSSEASSQVDTTVLDDTDTVQIGEMI
jgi:hypothetical protein